jgi:hypothetical protein
MRAIFQWGGSLLAVLLFTSVSFGQYYLTPVARTPYRQAPDMSGPGFYVVDDCGCVWGPVHCVYPPFPPFQGVVPCPPGKALQAAQGAGGAGGAGAHAGQQLTGIYPTHPYVRGPRDFFMWNEVMEDNRGRGRPNLVVP